IRRDSQSIAAPARAAAATTVSGEDVRGETWSDDGATAVACVRLVVFHRRLTVPTGGEVNTRDWALGLKARGHRVVLFTVYPGPLAEQIRNSGIAVVDDPSSLSDTPDI